MLPIVITIIIITYAILVRNAQVSGAADPWKDWLQDPSTGCKVVMADKSGEGDDHERMDPKARKAAYMRMTRSLSRNCAEL